MACNAGTYTIETEDSHNPTWNGTLVIAEDGTAQFTLDGGAPGSGSVMAHCGIDDDGEFLDFTNTNAHPAVHYRKAYWDGEDFEGECDDDSKKKTEDTWTATPSQIPGGEHKHRR